MIITTQRSSTFLVIDAMLTAIGWIGFFFLFTKGVVSILDGTYDSPKMAVLDHFMPTVTTLAAYLLVGVFNALVIVLWARYHALFSNDRAQHSMQVQVDDDTVALHFQLSRNQLHEIQDSRVTVIYHSTDGAIAHLETDQLRMQPAGNTPAFEAAKVA